MTEIVPWRLLKRNHDQFYDHCRSDAMKYQCQLDLILGESPPDSVLRLSYNDLAINRKSDSEFYADRISKNISI